MAKSKQIQIELVRSLIGSKKDQIATAHALGLHKIGDVAVQPDIPATQGKVRKISHLIKVSEATQGGAK
ncbi:MAG TPA: 50S ribosomal protein L30 [Clostridia bacterium]|nr:50S ribosomal protein L30 [Clostridia bacterium]